MSILRVSRTFLHEESDGTVVEYRRVFYHRRPSFLDLEHRVLAPDGTPLGDGWYPVSDDHLAWIQRQGTDIVDYLVAEVPSAAGQ